MGELYVYETRGDKIQMDFESIERLGNGKMVKMSHNCGQCSTFERREFLF
jgi:hypothetical protein